jgi:hypothetical protein
MHGQNLFDRNVCAPAYFDRADALSLDVPFEGFLTDAAINGSLPQAQKPD